jgi:hypothetical protein
MLNKEIELLTYLRLNPKIEAFGFMILALICLRFFWKREK